MALHYWHSVNVMFAYWLNTLPYRFDPIFFLMSRRFQLFSFDESSIRRICLLPKKFNSIELPNLWSHKIEGLWPVSSRLVFRNSFPLKRCHHSIIISSKTNKQINKKATKDLSFPFPLTFELPNKQTNIWFCWKMTLSVFLLCLKTLVSIAVAFFAYIPCAYFDGG